MTHMSTAEILPTTQAFLAASQNLLIDGQDVEAKNGATFDTFNPSTGEVLASVAQTGPEDVDKAVRAARAALEGSWARTTSVEKGRLIYRLADQMEELTESLSQLESLNNGSLIGVSRFGLLPGAIAHLRYFAGLADKIQGATVDTGIPDMQVRLEREAVGVVAAIVPWNFPLTMAVWKIAPALAAGCTVILKPAEQTPLTAIQLGRIARDVGFPDGVLQILPGAGETGAALVEHPGVDKIAFTGSVEVGKKIQRTAVETMKRVSLELGGKSPNIILDDADLETAIPQAASGIFFNSGQVCSAGSRLLIQSEVYEDVLSGLVNEAERMEVGPALGESTMMGPLISREQLQNVDGYVRGGVEDGGSLLTGGALESDGGFYYRPTIMADAPASSRIVREEVFGPVVVAQRFDSLEALAAEANDTDFGLAAAIFSRDERKARRLAKLIRAGSIWINTYGLVHPAVPFGGFKMSGAGRDGGIESLEQYLETKAIWTA